MKNFDAIDDTFDTSTTEVTTTPEGGCTTRKNQLTDVTDPDQDYEYTRGNLYSLIEKGQEAMNGILEVAQETDSPRAYEVAGQLIKSVGDTTDKLLDLQKKMKDLGEDKGKPTNITNNAIFVGSTAELQKALKQSMKDNK
jgi:hypothetical protein